MKSTSVCPEWIAHSEFNRAHLGSAELLRLDLGIFSLHLILTALFLAVPLGAMREAFERMRESLPQAALITDGGSAKGSVVEDCRRAAPELLPRFIPGHPIAGTEKNGVEASFAELYRQRRVILTPLAENAPQSVAVVRRMWEACGAEVTEMSVVHHDEVLAATSHLPNMLAFGLVDMLARMKENDEIFRYAAGGFRDFTRIAASDPVMWRDVFLTNKAATLEILGRFTEELFALQRAIRTGDGERLFDYFTHTRAIRRGIIEAGQDTDAPNFGRAPGRKE